MYSVVFNIRLPRILAALLVGAALSTAGAAYQGMFQNPLVSPDILGGIRRCRFRRSPCHLLLPRDRGDHGLRLRRGSCCGRHRVCGQPPDERKPPHPRYGPGRHSCRQSLLRIHVLHQTRRRYQRSAAGHHLLADGQPCRRDHGGRVLCGRGDRHRPHPPFTCSAGG